MTASIHDIAEELRDTGRTAAVLAARLADTVHVEHVPPGPSDGPMPGRVIAIMAREEQAATSRGLQGLETASEVSVSGDRILVRGRLTGALPDGAPVDVASTIQFTVLGDEITGIRSEIDPAAAEVMGAVLGAGGFQVPDDLFVEGL